MALTAVASVERALSAGPLASGGGVTVLDGFPSPAMVAALRREALAQGGVAGRQCGVTRVVDEGRGDVPGRALGSGPGGEVQDAFYAAPELHAMLAGLCGTAVRPTGDRGSYSYYTRPGDHLDLHVDVVSCDVTLITVLHDSTPELDPGGALVAFPTLFGASLGVARAHTGEPTVLKAPPGASVVILGGLVPHRIHPLTTGTRVISVLCFEAVA